MNDRTLILLVIVGAVAWYVMRVMPEQKSGMGNAGSGGSTTNPTTGNQQQAGQDLFNNILGTINGFVKLFSTPAQTAPERN